MQQRFTVITLAANNLETMRSFYEQILEWKPTAVNNDLVFYQCNGFLLSIAKRALLGDFIGVPTADCGFRSVTFGYNVGSVQEVRDMHNQLKNKGVKILKEPTAPPFGGLFFYFQDVEGNVLEVACNDFIPLDSNNNAIGHKPIDHL